MEEPRERPSENGEDTLVERVRAELDEAQAAGDEARLEALEKTRRDLEAELDSSLEDGTAGH